MVRPRRSDGDYSTMLNTMVPTTQLPPLIHGKRYDYEIDDPTPVPINRYAEILKLLRNYYMAQQFRPTSSTASRTSAPSISSAGTSQTEMTVIFSVNTGLDEIPDDGVQRLPDSMRTRKALLRKLEACVNQCRRRKVKCMLYHHRLRDLLAENNSSETEALVEWAIRFDALIESPQASTPVTARVENLAAGNSIPDRHTVVDQIDDMFDLNTQSEPGPYQTHIQESSNLLLEGDDTYSPLFESGETKISLTPVQDADTPRNLAQEEFDPDVVAEIFSTSKVQEMFPLGERIQVYHEGYTIRHWACRSVWSDLPDCSQFFPTVLDLLAHFRADHFQFQELQGDPERLACAARSCERFHSSITTHCTGCNRPEPIVKVYALPRSGIPTIIVDPTMVRNLQISPLRTGRKNQSSGSHSPGLNSNPYQIDMSAGGYSRYEGSFYYRFQSFIRRFIPNIWFMLPSVHFQWQHRHRFAHFGKVITAIGLLFILVIINVEVRGWVIPKLLQLESIIYTAVPDDPIVFAFLATVAFTICRYFLGSYTRHMAGSCGGRCPLRFAKNIRLACWGQDLDEADAGRSQRHPWRSLENHT